MGNSFFQLYKCNDGAIYSEDLTGIDGQTCEETLSVFTSWYFLIVTLGTVG